MVFTRGLHKLTGVRALFVTNVSVFSFPFLFLLPLETQYPSDVNTHTQPTVLDPTTGIGRACYSALYGSVFTEWAWGSCGCFEVLLGHFIFYI